MGKINLKNVTKEQKEYFRECLRNYCFIMEQKSKIPLSEEFKNNFNNFYLKARRLKNEYKPKYFKELNQRIKDTNISVEDFDNILNKLNKITGAWEISITSKLMHTVNPDLPIFDSKVKNYLIKYEDVILSIYGKGEQRKQAVLRAWCNLNNWYNNIEIKKSDWIDWFDKEFPEYKDRISATKKVDFIIFCLS